MVAATLQCASRPCAFKSTTTNAKNFVVTPRGAHGSTNLRLKIAGAPCALPEVVSALHPVVGAVSIDWSDPDVQIGALGAFLGLALGIGAPIFYISRDERDEERLEELRALNRATKEETGEYMSQEELEAIRPPRWTDRREFVDDD